MGGLEPKSDVPRPPDGEKDASLERFKRLLSDLGKAVMSKDNKEEDATEMRSAKDVSWSAPAPQRERQFRRSYRGSRNPVLPATK
jgi:hypothetical protein